ncbi:peptidoglycan-binding protein [Yoonia sp.]|uniref:peptidoglycan-binding domain-containing protein n=1 Tax=Yoonia sp. TaxID=2212373 RepID=UPI0019FD0835|nr:peptidoglycan-binding protein [Yoonia sp.]MBE0412541.1 peptidoglycan-binding protein [Yoonia sp.]
MRNLMLTTALIALGLPALADDAALLIGVERYQDLRRLSGGADVARANRDLRDAGYVVTALTNGSARDTQRVLGEFMSDVGNADRLVVGLSGRFMTDGERTWFLTADARQPSLFTIASTAVSLESLMAVLARVPGQAVLVLGLDASANATQDEYLREGLGRLNIPQGVSVVISPPNLTDDVLSDAVARPGGNIMAYVSGNRRLAVQGYAPQVLVLQPDEGTPAVQTPVLDSTLVLWERAQAANTADSYRDFLSTHPNSPYAAEARRRLGDIENDPLRIAQLAEEALNLSRNERRALQQNLTLLDYNTRGVDGIFGPGTRGAIRNWQQTNGFAQTGYLTAEQISRIDGQASRRAAAIAAEEAEARAAAERLDRAFWEETGARGDQAGYRAYLDRYPEGLFAREARAALEKLQANQSQGNDLARAEEEALNINPVLARLIESRLDQLGFDPGPVDGRFDDDTRRALARYQAQRNLPATGYLNQPTLARLLADTFGR